MAVAIRAEKLLRELDEVWVSLGKDQQETGGVLRACAMTLITLIDDQQGTDPGEALAELMHDHPARAIVIRAGGSGDLDAHCTAQCWMPFGRRQQICCEQIEIQAPLALLGDVPAVLRGLLVPDLPVVVWLRSPSLLKKADLEPFFELAQKIIIEPRGFDDSTWLIDQIRAIAGTGKPVADLAWVRITRWRETIARLFDDPERLRALKSVNEILIRHSSAEAGPAAKYLAAWLRISLGHAVTVRFEQAGSANTWQIQCVILRGPDFSASITRSQKGCVETAANGLSSHSVFAPLREADLLREELSVPGRDPIFERVLAAV